MFIETIDLLRCPRDHEETWLVAAFTKMNGRFVVEGSLGCPICEAAYPIVGGIADFREGQSSPPTAGIDDDDDKSEQAIRLAAFLNLVRPGSTVVLEGDHASLATEIATITQCRVISLNSTQVSETEQTSTIYAADRVPLGTSSVDGIAATNSKIIEDAARILKPGGRLVAPANSLLLQGLNELARDAINVVAEAPAPLIRLSRLSG